MVAAAAGIALLLAVGVFGAGMAVGGRSAGRSDFGGRGGIMAQAPGAYGNQQGALPGAPGMGDPRAQGGQQGQPGFGGGPGGGRGRHGDRDGDDWQRGQRGQRNPSENAPFGAPNQ
jgi:hypothetical protein